jgi:uncharacterized membrane protein
MADMANLKRKFAGTLLLVAMGPLVAAAFLANQELRVVRMPWGIFDIRVGNAPAGNRSAAIALAVCGSILLVAGVKLLRSREDATPRKRGR